MSRRRTVVGAALLAGLCAVLLNLDLPTAVQALLAAPLVFLLPGYTVTSALFARRPLAHAPSALLAVGLSVVAVILSTLVLEASGVALRPESWSIALAAVTLAGALVAVIRGAAGGERLQVPSIRIRDAAFAAVAVLIVAGAVVLARTPLPAKSAQGFTALWLREGASGSSARVGVVSSEQAVTGYRLEVRGASGVVFARDLTLGPGEEWSHALRLPSGRTAVRALLYRSNRPGRLYRSVRIAARN